MPGKLQFDDDLEAVSRSLGGLISSTPSPEHD
jgi:hypothetical protein